MQNDQEWNALVPGNIIVGDDFVAGLTNHGRVSRFPAGTHGRSSSSPTTSTLSGNTTAVRHPERPGRALAGEWHVEKPISAIQDQLQLRRSFGRHTLSVGGLRRQLHPGQPLELHRHPHRRAGQSRGSWTWSSRRRAARPIRSPRTDSGTSCPTTSTAPGQTSIVSRRAGRRDPADRPAARRPGRPGRVRRLRAELGEHLDRSTSTAIPTTTYDNETFGNNSFRHFTNNITDWAGSLGLNYRLNDELRRLRVGVARLQDAGARRAAERHSARRRWTSSTPARCSRSRAASSAPARPRGVHGQRVLHQA